MAVLRSPWLVASSIDCHALVLFTARILLFHHFSGASIGLVGYVFIV